MVSKSYNIEYEEAPSGNVTFYNYKEPLMKFKDGHGFVGALVFDTESGNIQCHFCGQWFKELGNHIHREHALDAQEYKRLVGLNKSTALINEKIRAQLIKHGRTHKKNLSNLRPGGKQTKATRAKIQATLKENRDEMKNLHGTCPEQLIERLVKLHDKKGITPRTKEIPFYDALIMTYGSYPEACRVAGIPERHPGQTINRRQGKYKRAHVVEALHTYFLEHGNFNGISKDLPRSLYSAFCRMTNALPKEKEAILREAVGYDGRYRKVDRVFHYTDEELLDFIRRFREINGTVPSSSDCKRGLLPAASKYVYHFGGWRKALETAFPGESYPDQVKEPRKVKMITPDWTLRQKFKRNKKRILAKRNLALATV